MINVRDYILDDREQAFTHIDLIPDQRFPLFEKSMVHLFDLLDAENPLRILDTGSGLTSVLLRKYHPKATIITADDQQDWLDRTKELARRMKVGGTGYYWWHDFLQMYFEPFTFIVHDLGGMDTRANTLDTVLRMASQKRCYLFLDNFGISPYKEYAFRRMTEEGFYSVFPEDPLKLSIKEAGEYAIFFRKKVTQD